MGKTIHWGELYQQLRKQIPDEYYHTGCEVVDINTDKTSVTLSDGRTLHADLIICADGSSSICRTKIYPSLQKEYAGYVAWRGIATQPHYLSSDSETDECIYYYGTPDGHLGAYNILDNGKKKLNWVLYLPCEKHKLPKLLTGKNGVIHNSSLPPGFLPHEAQQFLHRYAICNLPSKMAQLICETPAPFIQGIYSLEIPSNVHGRVCVLGDAGHIYRPHGSSAATMAIKAGLSLATLLSSPEPVDTCLKQWNYKQMLESENLHKLSRAIAKETVEHPRDWRTLSSAEMSNLWNGIMAGKEWYFTTPIKNHTFFGSKPLLPQNGSALPVPNPSQNNIPRSRL